MWGLFFKFTFWAKTDLVLVLNHDVNTSCISFCKLKETFHPLLEKLKHADKHRSGARENARQTWQIGLMKNWVHMLIFKWNFSKYHVFTPLTFFFFCKLVYASLKVGMHENDRMKHLNKLDKLCRLPSSHVRALRNHQTSGGKKWPLVRLKMKTATYSQVFLGTMDQV